MKKLKLNMLVAFLCNVFYIISGIVAQRFILHSYGSEINGLTGSVMQFLSYFTLLEAGLGTASIQALYRPLATGDTHSIEGILSATSRQYKKIGSMFLLLTVILSAAMPFISHSSLDAGLVFVLTLLMGGASAVNYLFIGRYQVLLRADRKVYILNLLDSILGTLFTIIRIIMINQGYGIVSVQAVALLSPLFRILILRIYFRLYYSHISYRAEPDFAAIGKRKYVLVHQIVGMISNNTPVTILTLFASLSQVSVYTVYNLIYSNINSILSSTFSTAVEPSFGKLMGEHSADLNKYYKYYELLFTFFLSWLLSAALVMTVPFVKIYTEGVTGADYVDPVLALLFMISIYVSMIRVPAIMMVNVSGAFRETQKGAILEAIINIAVSIPAFILIGMRGLLLGTCVSIAYRMWDVQQYIYRNVLKIKLSYWFRLLFVNVGAMAAYIFLIEKIHVIHYDSWVQWLISGVLCAVLGLIFYTVVAFVFYPQESQKVGRSIADKFMRKKNTRE